MHRDLRPANVLVTAAGPRVVDVGIVRAAAASPLTRGGGLIGAAGYLAPEQFRGGPGEPASDVFADDIPAQRTAADHTSEDDAARVSVGDHGPS